MKQLLSLLLILAISIAPFSNVFADQAQFDQLVEEAGGHFEKEEYDLAVQKFKEAYGVKPVSNILYNIARIYEKAGDIDNAIDYYDQFVVAPDVEQEPRQDALERLKTWREIKELREKGEEPPRKEGATTQKSPNGTLAAIFLGVGLASLAGSGVFAILTANKFSDFEDAQDLDGRRSAGDSGRSFGVIADSLLLTGIVTTAVGAIFWFTRPTESNSAQIGPTFDGKRVGVGLSFDY